MSFLIILLMLVWLAITAEFGWLNILFGFFLALLVVGIGEHTLPRELLRWPRRGADGRYPVHLGRLILFAGFFLREMFMASVDVAITIIMRRRLRPGVIAVPLSLTRDIQITLLANLITLTPGTLTLEVSEDKKTIYVHAIHVSDPETFRNEIKNGFERRILEVLP
jgi:multicomponent Na+:H+ antiporter subunit E